MNLKRRRICKYTSLVTKRLDIPYSLKQHGTPLDEDEIEQIKRFNDIAYVSEELSRQGGRVLNDVVLLV